MDSKNISFVVASDVATRDGIGLETYVDGTYVMEIFRDDTQKRTYVTFEVSEVVQRAAEIRLTQG